MKKLFTLFTALLVVCSVGAKTWKITAGTNKLHAALQESTLANGDSIELAAGTYNETDYANFNKNVTVIAAANAATAPVVKTTAYLKIGPTSAAQVKIEGISFDGTGIGSRSQLFRFYSGDNGLELVNCSFSGCLKKVIRCDSEPSGSFTYFKAKGCTFTGSKESVFALDYNDCGYVRFENCSFISGEDIPIKVASSTSLDSIVLRNCSFSSNAVANAVSVSGSVGCLRIEGGEYKNFTGNVINTSAALDSCIIRGNSSFHTNTGAHAANFGASVGYINLSGSTFKNFTGTIVETSAALDSCVIKNCTFQNCTTAHAISFGYATKYIGISGSSFKDFTGIIIAPTAAFDSCVINNCIFDGGTGAFENTKTCKYLGIGGCEFKNFSDKIINNTSSAHLDSCIIKNCYFHNNTKSAIYFESNSSVHPCDKVHITNSTFAHFLVTDDKALIEVFSKGSTKAADPNDDAELKVDHCTFYNYKKASSSTYGFIDSRKSTKVTVSNCIFVNPEPLPTTGECNPKATQLYGGSVTNCLVYGARGHRTDDVTPINPISGDPLFVDSAAMNFHFEAGSPALNAGSDLTTIGDPRWWTYGRGVTIGRFGTICLPYGVKAGTYSGATFYSIAGKRLDGSSQPYSLVLEIVSGDLKAGQPYFFEASAASLTAPYDGTPAEAGNYNGLFGTLVDLNSDAMDALVETKDIYLLSNNTVVKAGTGCSLTANRAYIDMEKVPEYVEPSTSAPGIREIPMAPQSGTSLQNVENAETIVKFIENGRVLIRRDGVTYDALGRVVR